MLGSDLIVNNLTVLGNLTMDNQTNNQDSITVNKIMNTTQTNYLNLNDSSNGITMHSEGEMLLDCSTLTTHNLITNTVQDASGNTITFGSGNGLSVNTGLSVNGTVGIGEGLSANGSINAGQNISCGVDLYVAGDIIMDQLYISGDSQSGYIRTAGSYPLNLGSNGNGFMQLTPQQTVNITSNIQSTSTTTGSLIVSGGVGISENVNIGGSLSVGGSPYIATKAFGSNFPYFVFPYPNANAYSGTNSLNCLVVSNNGSGAFPAVCSSYTIIMTLYTGFNPMGILNLNASTPISSITQSYNSNSGTGLPAVLWTVNLSSAGYINFTIY